VISENVQDRTFGLCLMNRPSYVRGSKRRTNEQWTGSPLHVQGNREVQKVNIAWPLSASSYWLIMIIHFEVIIINVTVEANVTVNATSVVVRKSCSDPSNLGPLKAPSQW
jgi:hypothetical protein